MSEDVLWATVALLAGITGVLLLRQSVRSRRTQVGPRRRVEPAPPERVWLRAGEMAHTIHTSGPHADAAVVLGPTTLADLLFDHPSDAGGRIGAALDELAEGPDTGLSRRIAGAVVDMLDLPVTGLVLQAWDEQPSVQEACARTRHVPGATAFVVATEHTLHTRQRPRVHVAVVERPEVVLELDLTVALTIDAVTITVVEGRVTGCVAGTTASIVELGAVGPDGQVHVLVRRVSGSVALGPPAPVAARS
jgi:hypothetical protein